MEEDRSEMQLRLPGQEFSGGEACFVCQKLVLLADKTSQAR
jgi:hypothetical protein